MVCAVCGEEIYVWDDYVRELGFDYHMSCYRKQEREMTEEILKKLRKK